MSTDYVKSLRSLAVGIENNGGPVTAAIMREAADEIERLCAKLNLDMMDDEILALKEYVQSGNNGFVDSPQRQHCRSAIKKLNEAATNIESERNAISTKIRSTS